MADGSSAPTWRKISLPLPHLLPNFGASNASSAGQKRKTGRDWSLRRQKTYDSPGCVAPAKKDDGTAVFSLSFKKVFLCLSLSLSRNETKRNETKRNETKSLNRIVGSTFGQFGLSFLAFFAFIRPYLVSTASTNPQKLISRRL